MLLQEQTIPGALSKLLSGDGKVLKGHQAPLWPHPTSRSQTAYPELHTILHSFTYLLSGQMLDLGARYRQSLGKPHWNSNFQAL